MPCVVKVPWMSAIFSLVEIPQDRESLEREGLEFEEGAWVEVPPGLSLWSVDDESLGRRALGRSLSDPKYYRMFASQKEAEQAGFEPTKMTYAGFYTPMMWARFTTAIPSVKAFYEIPDDEDPGAVELALSYLRRDR